MTDCITIDSRMSVLEKKVNILDDDINDVIDYYNRKLNTINNYIDIKMISLESKMTILEVDISSIRTQLIRIKVDTEQLERIVWEVIAMICIVISVMIYLCLYVIETNTDTYVVMKPT